MAVRHRGDLQERVEAARRTLGLAHQRLKVFADEVEALRSTSVTAHRLERYFDALVPDADTDEQWRRRGRVLGQLRANFDNERNTLAGMRGSAWAAFNAVSEFADHERRFRRATPQARAESRLDSVWFGASAGLKAAAYRSALRMAGVN